MIAQVWLECRPLALDVDVSFSCHFSGCSPRSKSLSYVYAYLRPRIGDDMRIKLAPQVRGAVGKSKSNSNRTELMPGEQQHQHRDNSYLLLYLCLMLSVWPQTKASSLISSSWSSSRWKIRHLYVLPSPWCAITDRRSSHWLLSNKFPGYVWPSQT